MNEPTNMKEVELYTDGACINNPGPGGYGAVLLYKGKRKELSGGFQHTTNNRMELLAAIKGLQALKEKCKVRLYSDSKYLVDMINGGYVRRWKANNWCKKGTQKAVNIDLWEQILELCEEQDIEFIWVKGHAGIQENERCDQLATTAAQQENLAIDEGYQPKKELRTEEKRETAENPKNTKMREEGQPCRKCNTPVVKKYRDRKKKLKEGQSYYFAYTLYCTNCKSLYLVDEAKVQVEPIAIQNSLF